MPDPIIRTPVAEQPVAEQPVAEQPVAEPARSGAEQACLSCGSPQARVWSTPDGPARLCPPCATLHGLGCP